MIDNRGRIGYNKYATVFCFAVFLLQKLNISGIINPTPAYEAPRAAANTVASTAHSHRGFSFLECKTTTVLVWSPFGRRLRKGHSAMNEVLTKAILPHLNISRNTQFKELSGLPRSLTVSFRASGLRAAITWQFMARPQFLSILTCDPPFNSPIPSAPIVDTLLPGAGVSLLRGVS